MEKMLHHPQDLQLPFIRTVVLAFAVLPLVSMAAPAALFASILCFWSAMSIILFVTPAVAVAWLARSALRAFWRWGMDASQHAPSLASEAPSHPASTDLLCKATEAIPCPDPSSSLAGALACSSPGCMEAAMVAAGALPPVPQPQQQLPAAVTSCCPGLSPCAATHTVAAEQVEAAEPPSKPAPTPAPATLKKRARSKPAPKPVKIGRLPHDLLFGVLLDDLQATSTSTCAHEAQQQQQQQQQQGAGAFGAVSVHLLPMSDRLAHAAGVAPGSKVLAAVKRAAGAGVGVEGQMSMVREWLAQGEVSRGCPLVPQPYQLVRESVCRATLVMEAGLTDLRTATKHCAEAAAAEAAQEDQRRGLPREALVHVAACLLAAVRHAHALGILHCDIKPANVLLCGPTCTPKLSDWGSTNRLHDPRQHCISGTPGFMPPEVCQHLEVGAGWDFWAIGITLYLVALGRSELSKEEIEAVEGAGADSAVCPLDLSALDAVGEGGPGGLRDLLENGLLLPNPHARAAFGASTSTRTGLMVHPFFKGVEWAPAALADTPLPHAQLLLGGRTPREVCTAQVATALKQQGGVQQPAQPQRAGQTSSAA